MKKVYLSGGLGNQMFQYAFFLSLKARSIPAKIIFNKRLLGIHNGYELNRVFGLEIDTRESIIRDYLDYYLYKYSPKFLVYRENVMSYTPDVYIAKQKYLRGFWMQEEYFKDIENVVRATFQFKNIDVFNGSLATEIVENDSVSLHIRRGDYLFNSAYNVCDERYYENSIKYINRLVSDPHYYVFSDDIEWAQGFIEKFGVKYTLVNFNRGLDSYKDMFLMSQCHNNIIANSSFSWWGAWLNTNSNKIVVAPCRWWNNCNKNILVKNWVYLK